MKKYIIILLGLIIFPVIKLAAQNPNRDKLNAYKIAFFTRKLNLTSEEAEKFWPVYNDYQNQKNLIQQDKMSLIRDFNLNESSFSETQLTETGDRLIADIVKESNLAVTFHKKLKEVLPPAKIIRLFQAENQYKAELLNELKEGKQQQRGMLKREL